MPARRDLPESLAVIANRQAAFIRDSEFDDAIKALITILTQYITPSQTGTIDVVTEQNKDEVKFNLGHQLEGLKYRTQLITLQRPDEGTKQYDIICHECGEIISITVPGFQEAAKNATSNREAGGSALGCLGGIFILAAIGELIGSFTQSPFNITDPNTQSFGVFMAGIVSILFGFASFAGSRSAFKAATNFKNVLRESPELQATPQYSNLLTPAIPIEYTRQRPEKIWNQHRLIAIDKKIFLPSESKRGLRDLRIPVEDRL